MFVYFDTSILLKTYVFEPRSEEAIALLDEANEAIPLSQFLTLELSNAFQLKVFRQEIKHSDANKYLNTFLSDVEKGYFYYPVIEIQNVFKLARDLSRRQTGTIGSRSMDILQVASALEFGCDYFLTFDQRQARLATAMGLKTEFE